MLHVHVASFRKQKKLSESRYFGLLTSEGSGVRCFRILDIPPLITLADMDNNMGGFEGSLQEMAKSV